MNHTILFFRCVFLLIVVATWPSSVLGSLLNSPKILIIDSYHEGYTWSDEVISSISSTISQSYPKASFTIEHLDTKRFNSPSYIEALPQLYTEKFKDIEFDLVFVSDDNAIKLLEKTAPTLFSNTPIIFSGYNDNKAPAIALDPRVTGVVERIAMQDTLAAAQRLIPDAKKILIINDKTVTGEHNQAQIDALLPLLQKHLEVEVLRDLPLTDICNRLETLDPKSIVYLVNYFKDNKGTFYATEHTTKSLVEASPAPIFTTYNFFFQNGVTGGVFVSGYQQGKLAAQYGLRILGGTSPKDLPVIADTKYNEMYSSAVLSQFGLPFHQLSSKAVLTDIQHQERVNILSIHSYSPTDPWTANIRQGIQDFFDASAFDIQHMIEFMATDFHDNLLYRDKMATLYEDKYRDTPLDAVLVSDLPAYNFVALNREKIFKNVPIIFCGLSREEYSQQQIIDNSRGVIRHYNFDKTTALALKIFPDTKRVFLVNDASTTSQLSLQGNIHKRLNIPEHIIIEESKGLSMQQLLERVANLPPHTVIHWHSFTKDINNQHFLPQESFAMVSQVNKSPIFSCRDDFFSKGILGGVIASGVEQGKMAAQKVLESLEKKSSLGSVPKIEASPSFAQIDYRKAEELGLNAKDFSKDVHLFYYSPSLWERYHEIFLTSMGAALILLFLVQFQHKKIRDHQNANKLLSHKAETDELTGLKTRTFLTPYLPKILADKTEQSPPLCLIYLDVDNLKDVNDKFGHNEGDRYIQTTAHQILLYIRSTDIACRVGGDEFIVILDGCTYEDGVQIGKNISHSVQNLQQEMNLAFTPSISFGLSMLNCREPQSAEQLIKEADGRMYEHKRKNKAIKQQPQGQAV